MKTGIYSFIALILVSSLVACERVPSTQETATPHRTLVPTVTVGIMCSDYYATAFAWEDLDSDGVRDESEPPLAGVCISAVHEWDVDTNFPSICYENKYVSVYTDANGQWWSPDFMAGGCYPLDQQRVRIAQQCSQIVITAYPLDGYEATTETTVIGCEAEFGFKRLPVATLSP